MFLKNAIVISNSKFTLSLYQTYKFFKKNSFKSEVIYPPCHIDQHEEIRFSDRKNVGYVGRVTEQKGVEDLLAATADLGIQIRVYGIGEECYINNLKTKYPHALFEGFASIDVVSSNLGIIVIPSKWNEPFGKVALEYLLKGKKVIIANSGGLTEAAMLSTLDFYTFTRGNQLELRGAIIQALNSTRRVDKSELDLARNSYLRKRELSLSNFKNKLIALARENQNQ